MNKRETAWKLTNLKKVYSENRSLMYALTRTIAELETELIKGMVEGESLQLNPNLSVTKKDLRIHIKHQ